MNTRLSQKTLIADAIRRFGQKQAQAYRIKVAGVIDPDWSDRLAGLRIEPLAEVSTNHPITALQGLVQDQAMLSGVLGTLCNLRLPLLSVELVEDTPSDHILAGDKS